MLLQDLWLFDAMELARLIADREVSAADVVDAHLRHMDAVDPLVHAVITRMDDMARRAAETADAAACRGDPLGPLHGVPFTVKDALDTANVRAEKRQPSPRACRPWGWGATLRSPCADRPASTGSSR